MGAGDMGTHHAMAWKASGHSVEAIVDVDVARARVLADRVAGANVYADFDQAVEAHTNADIVDVCVPLRWHMPLTVTAAQAGKHILCEKPLARSMEEADLMERAILDNQVKFACAFQRNLSPGVSLLAKWMRDGTIGTPAIFNSDLLQEVRPKRFMHDADNNNGPLVDTCPHYFLMWETVFGARPTSIYAQGSAIAESRPEIAHFTKRAIDTASITVRYEGGHVGAMTVSWGLAANTQMGGRPDRLVGPNGGAEAFNFHDFTWEGFNLFHGSSQQFQPIAQSNMFERQVELFVEYVDGVKPEPPTPLSQARHLLRMSLAALESINTGKTISLL